MDVVTSMTAITGEERRWDGYRQLWMEGKDQSMPGAMIFWRRIRFEERIVAYTCAHTHLPYVHFKEISGAAALYKLAASKKK